jgi:hypothetical protein
MTYPPPDLMHIGSRIRRVRLLPRWVWKKKGNLPILRKNLQRRRCFPVDPWGPVPPVVRSVRELLGYLGILGNLVGPEYPVVRWDPENLAILVIRKVPMILVDPVVRWVLVYPVVRGCLWVPVDR